MLRVLQAFKAKRTIQSARTVKISLQSKFWSIALVTTYPSKIYSSLVLSTTVFAKKDLSS
jgi:hypothetical protein